MDSSLRAAVHWRAMLSRLSLALCAALLFSSSALARSAPSVASQARQFPVPPIRAKAAVVMDATDGAVLVSLNAHLHLAIASTTKIMTALLALQLGHLSDRITVPKSAFNFESDATVMGLHPGQVVTLRDLLYGLMLPSGADAANTIAIHYAGSEARFVALMNKEAAVLGMHDTHYATPHGLDAPNQYSSAYDLAVLGQYVSYIPDLMQIAATRSYTWNGHVLTNLNHVLFWYSGVDGIKPGYTDAAGICQVLDARRGARHIVVTLLNTPDLVIDARNLLNYGLQDYTWQQSPLPGDSPAMMQQGSDSLGSYLYFPGSGHYLRRRVASSYLVNHWYPVLGLPRTELLQEGSLQVQYFQNGALGVDPATGRVRYLPVGLTPVPTPRPQRTPTATPTPQPLPPTGDAPVPVATSKPTSTRTPRARPTPTPHPTPTPEPSTTPVASPIFATWMRTHKVNLGQAVSALVSVRSYPMQIFAYGALLYDTRSRSVYLLPVGDHLLAARHYLPDHPGDRYPAGFAPASILQAIHWLGR